MLQAARTVYEAFCGTVNKDSAADFLCVLPSVAERYHIDAGILTYGAVAERVEQFRSMYRQRGYGHGHRIGLLLGNRPDFFHHWFALNSLGACVVPLNPDWRSNELEFVFGHSEIVLAVAPAERTAELARASHSAGDQALVVTADLASLADACRGPRHSAAAPDSQSECALLYTSGTTGRPKGCVLPNEYFLWAGEWYSHLGGACRIEQGCERLITPLPLGHMNAMAFSTMVMLVTGGCIVQLDRFHPATWWADVRAARATVAHYLGVMPAMLLAAPESQYDRQHQVRFGFGAGVSPRLHAAFESRFGFPLIEAWAMTETGAGAVVIANRDPRKVGTACFGRAGARMDYRVVDERGRDVGPDQPGELLVRGAGPTPRFGFFREYLKDADATAAVWRDGYLHTGDIVSVDADGDLHFVDRSSNVIRRSGENIAAVEVESVLLQHPLIAGAGVTAVPDPVRGDEVMACVITRGHVRENQRSTLAEEIMKFCLDRLAYFKAPGYVTFCDQLPLTATAKIQRSQLRELALRLVESTRCVDTRPMKRRMDRS